MKLSDAIDEYVSSRLAVGIARSTTRNDAQALGLLLAEVGNISVKNLDARHGEAFMARMLSSGFKPGTVNHYRGVARRFFAWCQSRRYMHGTAAPLATTRNLTVNLPPRRRIPAAEFPRLLDLCDHPQQRIIVALGLYLFLRASEITALSLGDVDLSAGEMRVYQPKTKRWDEMPICEELDTELRRWLVYYASDVAGGYGSLMKDWPLVPSRLRPTMENDGTGLSGGRPVWRNGAHLNPKKRLGQAHLKVQAALEAFGWEVTAEDREGVHTLRRSGARALFDELVTSGEVRDGVLRVVSALLHHKSVTMTEHYLGLEADRERRDTLFRGRRMFAAAPSNVVPLEAGVTGVMEA